ncbi:VC0807 family protein [Deinococcus sp. YIM 77859]|uniref:VC0807 family protein n=1 Tax=Deinococcus sp. YIM 77859 TaxID=1540221 RepID=UPI00054EC7DD|nr:VC0807 family protein [Deinococcus sp. YIM 77859]
MSAPQAAQSRSRIPKTIWDLIFTLAIPILILSPNLLGQGIGVSDLLGGGTAGNVRAYLIAALVPVVYVLADLFVNRNVSPVALIGGAGAILSGALAFWYVDGFWYAIKDSARSYLMGLLFLASAATRVPLFRVFLDAASLGEKPADRAVTEQALRDPQIHRGVVLGTVVFAAVDLLGGVVNSAVNYQRVTAKFGTDAFNAQVAEVNALMRVPSLVISLIGVGLAISLVQAAVKRRYGAGASLLEPSKLAEKMRERGELTA